jgi:prephenate dehydrogenase
MKALDDSEFTIVGTGLMGASLALALRGKVKTLRGVERDPVTRQAAASYFDTISDELSGALDSDVIVLAVPILAILEILQALAIRAKSGTLIMDLGSSKQEVVQAMNALPEHLLAIGAHPMCGKETSGPQYADGTLYKDHPFVLCHTRRTTGAAWEFACAMVTSIGAQAIDLDAAQHDQAVAMISHLPYLLSVGLVATTQQAAQADATPWHLAASGFRDTSRLAGSNVSMMGDTLLTNRSAVLTTLAAFRQQLDHLESALKSSDEAALHAILETSRQARLEWLKMSVNPSE